MPLISSLSFENWPAISSVCVKSGVCCCSIKPAVLVCKIVPPSVLAIIVEESFPVPPGVLVSVFMELDLLEDVTSWHQYL